MASSSLSPRIVLVGVVIVVAALAVYWFRFRSPEGGRGSAAAASSGERVVPVLTAPAERRDQPLFLEGIGSVTPLQTVTVRAQVDGRLDSVAFKEGEDVKKGQLLAQVDARPFSIQLRQAEANLAKDKATIDNAQINLSRFQGLRDQGLAAPQQVDDQKALLDQAQAGSRSNQAAIEGARLNLTYARITSPIDGRTGVRQVDPGNLVHPTDATGIVVITQLDPIAVLFSLPEDDLPAVQDAMKLGALTVEALARDGRVVLGKGTVSLVDNQINPATGTIKIKAIFPNGEHRLWPNQFVKAKVLVSVRKGALVVPAAAVQRGPKGTFVYVVGEGNKVLAKPIELDRVQGEAAVLVKGVEPGESVVVDGQFQLKPGGKVIPRPAGSGGPRPESGDEAAPARKGAGATHEGGPRPSASAAPAPPGGAPSSPAP